MSATKGAGTARNPYMLNSDAIDDTAAKMIRISPKNMIAILYCVTNVPMH